MKKIEKLRAPWIKKVLGTCCIARTSLLILVISDGFFFLEILSLVATLEDLSVYNNKHVEYRGSLFGVYYVIGMIIFYF